MILGICELDIQQCTHDVIAQARPDVTIEALDGDWFIRMQLLSDVTASNTMTSLNHVFVQIVNTNMLRITTTYKKSVLSQFGFLRFLGFFLVFKRSFYVFLEPQDVTTIMTSPFYSSRFPETRHRGQTRKEMF